MPRMANSHKTTATMKPEVQKPARVPVGGYRDVLEVLFKEPGFYYRWVLDSSEDGGRIATYKMAGYEMVDADTHKVPKQHTFTTSQHGSVIRLPCKNGDFMYLMRLPEQYREEDRLAHEQRIDELENQISNPNPDEGFGQYGSNKISTHSEKWES